uniref:Uncharacterized protein n=1 Tax=Physcomitrium patens TaxID=3218 RepID=A0A2K1J575_PHYPA|nr:hypothetical protein PHYPA_022519 [Physcomitrium patens]
MKKLYSMTLLTLCIVNPPLSTMWTCMPYMSMILKLMIMNSLLNFMIILVTKITYKDCLCVIV